MPEPIIRKKENEMIKNPLMDFKNTSMDTAGGANFSGVFRGALPFFVKNVYKDKPSLLMVIVPSDSIALSLYNELSELYIATTEAPELFYFPSWGILPFTWSKPDAEREGARARTLSHLISSKKPSIIVTSADAVIHKLVTADNYKNALFELKAGYEYSQESILEFLETHGYQRCDLVENHGQYSKKGGVIDIFSPSYFNPIRIDFFGDEIESIHFFDPDTQRSYEKLEKTTIFPRRDIVFNRDTLESAASIVARSNVKNLTLPPFLQTSGSDLHGLWDIYPLLYETTVLFKYLSSDARIVVWESDKLFQKADNIIAESTILKEKNSDRFFPETEHFFISSETVKTYLTKAIMASYLPRIPGEVKIGWREPAHYKGKISKVVSDFAEGELKGKEVIISASTEAQKERIEHIFNHSREIIKPGFILSLLSEGFINADLVLITEKELFGKSVRTHHVSKSTTQILESFTDLTNGDYVVHVNYGIGQFVALKRMKAAGNVRDFLEIEFGGADRLYVPLEQLHFVHKYIGSTENPRLDFLGKKSTWSKTKSKVSAEIEKTALELLELYARREKSVSIKYPSDSRFQEEFEAAFPYDETDHQISSINDVKKDMESLRCMDRLICGDVGFGKTEVAIRAAFKAVMAGKQVGVLCPTTILAFQHYNTFCERFRDYPVSIDYISRFRTPAEVKIIKENIKNGKVDIVIGTHALLSSDIKWKDVGLLVVDEEQKFGVQHKESIKKMRANVDCITMTATPIPRTLQMSLVGIRDLSLIETPPRDRMKIETYVLEESDEILTKAIEFELARQGQLFILHNRIQTISAQASRIQKLVPYARIVTLHGQMHENDVEEVMIGFLKKEFDILISTTIIESGINIPNANTLIVMNAQMFGLSQLYQIKGRVGRSDIQAYAYFFYPPSGSMNEIAQKRLNTLQEYDGLGDGFKIAMKDLEIRGAGNILGTEQSGDIMAVGFEMYIGMLQDKIKELKNEPVTEEHECIIALSNDFYFPDEYIVDTRQKMEFYKKMSSAKTILEMEAIEEEMRDRFGELPEIVKCMVVQERIRIIGRLLKLEKISGDRKGYSIFASGETELSMERMIKLIKNDKRFSLDNQDARKINFISQHENVYSSLRELSGILEYLIEK